MLLPKLTAFVLLVALSAGCSERTTAGSGQCSKSPELRSLPKFQQLALVDAAERSKDICIASGMDCSRIVRVSANGKIAIFIEIAQWNPEENECQGQTAVATYEYDKNGYFKRELLTV